MKVADLPEMTFPAGADGCPVRNLVTGQQEAPFVRLESPGLDNSMVLVADTAKIDQVYKSPDVFVSRRGPQARRFDSSYSAEVAEVYAAKGLRLIPLLAWSDGESHLRYRRLVDTAFHPGKIELKKPYIAEMIEGLIDRFPAGGEVDFMSAFATQLPAMVMLKELGLDADNVSLLQSTANHAAKMLDFTSASEEMVAGAHAVVALQEVLTERIKSIRETPENNLLSNLVHATSSGHEPLSDDELLSMAIEVLVAGAHSTAAMLGWCVYVLAKRPDLHRRLRDEPEKAPDFVEEVLRRHGAIVTSYRTAETDTGIDELAIPEGTHVTIRLDCANMDAERWTNPDTIDIDRPHINRHYAFGKGKHTCIGNALARAEMTLSVRALVRRFDSVSLTTEPEACPSFDGHFLGELPVVFA